jgi:predicted small integral membrane protein
MLHILKSIAVCSSALFFTLVAFGNITDYASNYSAVTHVLSMDTTFKTPETMWRAITSPLSHQIAYWIIIMVEIITAAILWVGGIGIAFFRRQKPTHFKRYRNIANLGLFLGFILYFLGFIIIAGEWFCMWQSKEWNAVPTAAIFASMFMFILLFLNQTDSE